MDKRVLIGATAALFVVGEASASEDRDCTRQIVRAPRVDVSALFARNTDDLIQAGEGIELPSIEIVLVRIGEDGKPALACVDNPEAAKRFLEGPVRSRGPQEK